MRDLKEQCFNSTHIAKSISIIYSDVTLTGALLQKLNRDTQKCAFKCSYALVDGKDVSY